MTQLNRRNFVGSAGIAGAAIAGGVSLSGLSPAAMAAQDDPTEIVFFNIWGTPPGGDVSEDKHPVDQVIEAFNEQSTGVQVTGQTPGSYYETLQKAQAQIAAGDAPALVITPWASINYAYEGLGIVPLEDIAGDGVAEAFSVFKDQVIPLVQVDGNTVGMPYAFSCPVIYYNADILKEAGVEPDALFETWDSLLEQGVTVQEALDGNPIFGVITNPDWPAQSIIQSNGGMVLNEENVPVMDSPEAIAAMQAIADLDSAGLYARSTSKEDRASFLGGSIACISGSIASLGSLSNNASFDLQTHTFPVFEGKPRKMASGGSFIGIYAREEEQQQAAWEFMKFAMSEEGYGYWMQTGYLNPTTYDLPRLEGQEAAYIQLEEGLTRETPWPTARGGELQAIWGDFVARIWANDISAEEGCKQAVEEISAMIEQVS